jgi:hypothetical protein
VYVDIDSIGQENLKFSAELPGQYLDPIVKQVCISTIIFQILPNALKTSNLRNETAFLKHFPEELGKGNNIHNYTERHTMSA